MNDVAATAIDWGIPTPEQRLAEQLWDDVSLLKRPTPPALIHGRLVANSLIVVVGPPSVGKSFLMTLGGLCVASGEPFLGAAVEQRGPVVYVAQEGASGLPARVKAGKLALGIPLEEVIGFYTLAAPVTLLDAEAVGTLLSVVADLHPALIVFDTLARTMPGGEENSARDMGAVIASCDRIRRDTGAAVALVHHTGKSGLVERGSSALRGACDTLLALAQVNDLLELRCEKQKDAAPFPALALTLAPVPGTESLVLRLASDGDGRARGLTPSERRALSVLRTSFLSDGATGAEWDGAMPDVPERTRYRVRKVLVDRGFVEKRGRRFVWTGEAPDAPA